MAGPVLVTAPVVTGSPVVGQVLSCSTGVWTGAVSYTYQWLKETFPGSGTYADISGATASTYTLIYADVGDRIECGVTAYAATQATSLGWTVQPTSTNTNTNISPAPTVQVLDQFGNPFSEITTVTMTLSSGSFTGGSSTSGSTSSGGQITFSTLAIGTAGTYTMTASATGLTSTPASSSITIGTPASTPWSSSSAMNTPIPASPPIHPNSSSMIQNNSNFIIGTNWISGETRVGYVGPLSNFDDEPLVTFEVNFAGDGYVCGAGGLVDDVPWPTWLTTFLVEDDNYVDLDSISFVFDVNGNLWGGYKVSPAGYPSSTPSGCSESYYNALVMTLFSGAMNGVGYNGNYAFASGSCIAAGLLTEADLATITPTSVIPHALRLDAGLTAYPDDTNTSNLTTVFASSGWYGSNGAGTVNWVPPAYGGADSGQVSGAAGVPTGARIFLDSDATLTSLAGYTVNTCPALTGLPGSTSSGLQGAMMMIARTFQTYGAVVVDGTSAGAAALDCGYSAVPGTGTFPWEVDGTWEYYGNYGLPAELYQYMHVIDWTKWTGTGAGGAGT